MLHDQPNSIYHTSALLSAHVETVTLPLRSESFSSSENLFSTSLTFLVGKTEKPSE